MLILLTFRLFYSIINARVSLTQTHFPSVENRIVSIERPNLRPIVRGKVKDPVEFGAKYDLSIDNEGYGRIETISFDAYNESTYLQDAVERFKTRTGFYQKEF